MGNAAAPAAPQRPYVGCTADAAWRRAGVSEATIFDVYEIGSVLGSGSFAQVRLCWPVHESNDGGKYAVKIVDTKSEVFRQASSFISARQEANILKAVRHPHIVDLVDVFEKERWLFLVLECVTGGELFSALSDPHALVTEDCVAVVGRQLFSALRHIHSLNVVHRDVKAENILLASDPTKTGQWHIKLIDFGLAMRIEQPACLFQMCKDQEMPLEELICGTAYYCAPEVWVNDYSSKVDIWAAGVVLYLALHGTFPFYDRDAGVLEALICNTEREPSFKAVCAKECPGYETSSDAQQALSSLLAKDSDKRPNASSALALPWLRAAEGRGSAALQPRKRLSGGGGGGDGGEGHSATLLTSRSISAGSFSQHDLSGLSLTSADCKGIPAPIRAKAGRAAARPPVDPNKEQSRTKALEALKRRSVVGLGDLGGKTDSIGCVGDVPVSPTNSILELFGRSPLCKHRELTVEPAEKKGSGNILSFIDHDAPPSETSLSDSDVEDEGHAVCVCR